MNLEQWFSARPSQEDMREMFLRMDEQMKNIHSKGCYVSSFEPRNIMLNGLTPSFNVGKMDKYNYQQMMNNDVFRFAFMNVAAYSNCLNYLRPSFLKEHFDEFIPFLPVQDRIYYKSVIMENNFSYLSDYQAALVSQGENNQNFTGSNNGKAHGSYTKSTSVGKMYAEEILDTKAYINITVLSVLIITTVLITMLVVMSTAIK